MKTDSRSLWDMIRRGQPTGRIKVNLDLIRPAAPVEANIEYDWQADMVIGLPAASDAAAFFEKLRATLAAQVEAAGGTLGGTAGYGMAVVDEANGQGEGDQDE